MTIVSALILLSSVIRQGHSPSFSSSSSSCSRKTHQCLLFLFQPKQFYNTWQKFLQWRCKCSAKFFAPSFKLPSLRYSIPIPIPGPKSQLPNTRYKNFKWATEDRREAREASVSLQLSLSLLQQLLLLLQLLLSSSTTSSMLSLRIENAFFMMLLSLTSCSRCLKEMEMENNEAGIDKRTPCRTICL